MKKIFSLLASVCLILLTLPVGFTEVHAATVQNNYSENSANNGSGSFRTVKARAGINVASDDSVFSSGNQAANEMSIPKKEIIPGDRLGLLLIADINSNVNGSGDKLTLSAVLDKRITLDENSVITVNQNGDDRQVTLPWNDVTYDKANNTFSVEITPNTLGGPNLSGTIGVTVYAKSDTTIPEGYTTLPINLTAIYTNPDSQVYRSGVTSMYYEKGKAQINVHDSTIKVGDVWNAEDNFDSAVDGYGKLVALFNIQVDESQVETDRVGVFEVPYMYDGITSVAKVTVVNNAQDVTVRYVGGEGKELATSDTLSGNIGDAYTSAAKTIDGWKLKETPENATGTFSDTAQTVTYVYEKAAVAGRDVTVRYVDGAGKELATSDILSGNVGDTYTSIAKDIEGWKLKETPENATGTFSDTAQTVTYVYEKAAVAG
ncbi:MucBP domain-containing protein, partial [Listeria seeligeri]